MIDLLRRFPDLKLVLPAAELVAEAVETERIGQPLRRVDGEHEHLAAVPHGGEESGGRRGRRLTHPSGPATDEHVPSSWHRFPWHG